MLDYDQLTAVCLDNVVWSCLFGKYEVEKVVRILAHAQQTARSPVSQVDLLSANLNLRKYEVACAVEYGWVERTGEGLSISQDALYRVVGAERS